MIYAVPVFLSSGPHYTPVEVQFRTIAMDYWASLEHALRYKTDLPDNKLAEHSQTLLDCARSLQNIEVQMQNIHRDINDLFGSEGASRKIQRFETGLQIGGFESAMSVKYHVHQYTRRIPANLDVRGESFQEPII